MFFLGLTLLIASCIHECYLIFNQLIGVLWTGLVLCACMVACTLLRHEFPTLQIIIGSRFILDRDGSKRQFRIHCWHMTFSLYNGCSLATKTIYCICHLRKMPLSEISNCWCCPSTYPHQGIVRRVSLCPESTKKTDIHSSLLI